MIKIQESFSRYYSDFEGQEEDLNRVLDNIPKNWVQEVIPINSPPVRVWWNAFDKSKAEELKKVVSSILQNGAVIEEVEESGEENVEEFDLNKFCKSIGHNPERCEVLSENDEYILLKLPPVQRPKENFYKAPCVIKVEKSTSEYHEVFDCAGTRLGKNVLSKLIEEEMG